jgi:hypothetical protein
MQVAHADAGADVVIGTVLVADWAHRPGRQALGSLTEHGTVLACHWRHPFAERRSDTAALHAALDRELRAAGARSALRTLDQDFQLDVWTRAPQRPAERDGRR